MIDDKNYAYEATFNEGQRQILVKVLETCSIHLFDNGVGSGCGGYDTEYEEFVALLEMLRKLPQDEEEHKGEGRLLHGLCL